MSKKKHFPLLALFTVVSLIALGSPATQSCHILCNCVNSACMSCYNNFQSNSPVSGVTAATCPCPQGYYSFNQTCLYCAEGCKVCADQLSCLECWPGYTKVNGTCKSVKYPFEATWLAYQVARDFRLTDGLMPSIYGFSLFPNDSTITSFYLNCSGLSNDMVFGVKSTGNLSLSLIRTYLGLPYHQWAHLTIKYAALDTWNGQKLQLQLYLDSKLANKTYNNSLRSMNLCGGSQPDSIDSIHSFISHQKQSLAINITIPANVSLAILSIKLDVGTCPRNCLTCSSPTTCLECKNPYTNINGECSCNATLAHVVSYGCLEQCRDGYVFVASLERCVLCARFVRECYRCSNTTVCEQCNLHSFLSNGQCTTQCPYSTFHKKTPSTPSQAPHCHPCPTNCSSCYNETLCINCLPGLYLSQGQCVSACPAGTSSMGGRCFVVNACPARCAACTGNICGECQVGFWMFGGACVNQCPDGYYEGVSRNCLPCAANCSQCLDIQTCLSCQPAYTLRNGSCQYYSTNCPLSYYFDARITNCVACPQGCSSCFRTLCYTCLNSYYLDNGLCLLNCTAEKYRGFVANGTMNQRCYWRNQLCGIGGSVSESSCSRCRSVDFVLALEQATGTCRSYCPANLTYSPHSPILTDNSRTCNLSCPQNCQTCLNPSTCLKCTRPYLLSTSTPSTCLLSCQPGYISDSLQCLKCPYACLKCDISGNCLNWTQVPSTTGCVGNCSRCVNGTCVGCQAGLYLGLDLGVCVGVCAAGMFGDGVSGQCRRCQPQCSSCVGFSQCTRCIDGFYLSEGACLRECPTGRYPNPETLTCDQCSSNCRSCFGPKPHQCLTCYPGSTKDHAECIPSCPVHKYQDGYGSCDWCHESCRFCFGPAEFQCMQCDNSNFLYRGECYTGSCPAATYLAILVTRECQDCSWGCAYCTSSISCTQCFGGFYLSNGACLDVCPINTYYSYLNQSCIACTAHCQSCLSSSCHQCQPPYTLYNASCISQCPNTTFLLDYFYGLQCRACPQECSTCSSAYECTSCQAGLILRDGRCTRYCEPGKYYDVGMNSCQGCSGGCVGCTAWGCSECQIGYYWYYGQCVQNCPVGTYPIVQTLQCGACPTTCTSCSSFYQCSQCKTGYTLLNGICQNNQTCLTNCQQCADQNTCLICKQNYYRYTNSTGIFCVPTCPPGTYLYTGLQCTRCQVECLTCTDSLSCIQCQTGLILFLGQCITDCYPGFYKLVINGSRVCQPCSSECQACSSGASNCTACASATAVVRNGTCMEKRECLLSAFFSEALGYCVPCTAHCKTCHNPIQCDECLPFFYKTEQKLCRGSCPNGTYSTPIPTNPNLQQCTSCPFPCLTCLSPDQCTSCYPGYPFNSSSYKCQSSCLQPGYFTNPSSNTCEPCSSQCLACLTSSTMCTKCAEGFYLFGSACVASCPEGTFGVPLARACLPCGWYCQRCRMENQCESCQGGMVNFNGSCLPGCPGGYYKANGVCLPCVSPCRECTGGSTYQCLICEQGYYFFNNRCTSSCPDGYYKNQPTASCRPCPSSCKTCLSPTSCLTCIPPQTLNPLTLQCQSLPPCPSTLPTCLTCQPSQTTQTTQCSSCYNNFYLQNGQCVQKCTDGSYGDRGTGRCQACGANCTVCVAAGERCVDCGVGFWLVEGRCVGVCPTGMYGFVEVVDGVSVDKCRVDPCIYYATVNGTQVCTACVAPFILYNGSCISTCPTTTYPSQQTCQPCRQGCLSCPSLTQCTKCLPNYNFFQFDCLPQCPTGTYPYIRPLGFNYTNNGIQDGECLPCNTSCLVCTAVGQCEECAGGFYRTVEGKCVVRCPEEYWGNLGTGVCQRCSPACAACLSLDTCQRCTNGSYLFSGQCITTCPESTYPNPPQCQPCPSTCLTCSTSSNCSKCQPGYLLNRLTSQCIQQCPTGSYQTPLQECQPCPTACAACVSANQCSACVGGFVMMGGDCRGGCPSGYTVGVGGVCVECDSFCRECSIVRDNCTACQQNYLLQNGYCKNNCPTHTFRNSQNQCQSCSTSTPARCSECYGPAADQCLECYAPYILFNNLCVDRCPQGFYAVGGLTGLRECRACDVSCLACSGSEGNCTRCGWGYYLVNGRCVDACPSQFYPNPDPSNNTCLPCVSPCLLCDGPTTCKTCLSGFFVTLTGRCVTNCSSVPSTYPSQNPPSCQPCPSTCLSCTSPSTCTQCQPPLILHQSQCLPSCPTPLYYSATTNTCSQCNKTYCLLCASASQCAECLAGWYLTAAGDCVAVCPVGYVMRDGRCVDGGNATGCNGYWLNSTNGTTQCVEYCPSGYYPVTSPAKQCLPCSVACLACTGPTDCQTCSSPYKLLNNSCLNTCPAGYIEVAQICTQCSPTCLSCSPSPTSCLTCPSTSPYLFNGQCLSICPDGYYPDTTFKECRRCAEQCRRCTAVSQCTECVNTRYGVPGCVDNVCASGQYKVESTGQCASCDAACLTCSGGSSSNCLSCRSPQVLISGQCRSVCPSSFVLNSNNNTCIPCPNGCKTCTFTTPTSAPECTQCLTPKILNNKICLDSCTLLQTEIQAYTSNGSACIPCPSYCLDCVNGTSCTGCKAGYILYLGQCISQCPAQYYPIQNSCQKCPQNCLQCTSTANSCTSCTNNTYLYNGQCLPQCPPSTYQSPSPAKCVPCADPLCVNCWAGENGCQGCVVPYAMDVRGGCKGCVGGFLYNVRTGVCEACGQGCLACSGVTTNCTACDGGRALLDGQCVQQCPSGYYLTTSPVKQCKNCPTNCTTCQPSPTSPTTLNCYQCLPTHFHNLATHQCIPQCPSNTYITNTTDCTLCPAQCQTCNSAAQCTSCIGLYYLYVELGRCVRDCPRGYVGVDGRCERCGVGCVLCVSGVNCTMCRTDYVLNSNRSCDEILPCPVGKYADLNGTCQNCQTNCLVCTSLQNCTQCALPYLLLNNQCNSTCLATQYSITIQTSNYSSQICTDCQPPCTTCSSATHCRSCITSHYLTPGNTCTTDCGYNYYPYTDPSPAHNNSCQPCPLYCSNCTNSQACTHCISESYILVNATCIPYRCLNCTVCINQQCMECDEGWFLFQAMGQCVEVCPEGYWGDSGTKRCQPCMDNCVRCPSRTICEVCKDGFNFTGEACVDTAFVLYGSLSNMSGFTSNITKITSAVYLGTSIGPMAFGEMTTTYFNIEFCQFILFHAKAAGNNSEMQSFLSSLQSISLTAPTNSNQTQNGTRRLLATSLSDPSTFLATSAPIFGMMGGFLLVYILILILQHNMETSCLSCPRFKFYITEICAYMKKRFKWIYFDFVAWVSFLPFVYFSLMQLQRFSFATGLQGFSCILSIVIIVVYPLYPFWICYLLRQNYNDLVQENNQMVQMSLSPYVYKVKRPLREIMPGQPIRDYFTAENFRLIYDPLKYFRKFLFVLIVAVCHEPVTSLVTLIILNVLFVVYMAVFRPRVMPYLIFDFIIEGVLLFFEIFMLVYLTNQSAKVSTMSIAAHAIGFITANLSLIVAIILNLIAYYKIFMCIYEMYQHLKAKVEEKEKAEKGEEDLEHQREHQDEDLPEKEHDPLTKSLKGTKLRKSNGEDMTEFDGTENHHSGLIKDKEIFGNDYHGDNSEIKRSKGGLPDLKSTGKYKKNANTLEFQENSTNQLFEDKDLPKRETRVRNDDELTESNPDSKISKIQSAILKDKELYKGDGDGDVRKSTGEIPDLKSSLSKAIKPGQKVAPIQGSNTKLKNTNESDQDFMINSQLSGQQIIAIKDGKLKEQGKDRFKRPSLNDPNQLIVSEGVPIAQGKDKYRRNSNLKDLPRIDSINKNIEDVDDEKDIYQVRTKENYRDKADKGKDKQMDDAQFYEHRNRKKSSTGGNNQQIEEGKFRQNNQKKKSLKEQKVQQDPDGLEFFQRKKQDKNQPNNIMDIPIIGRNMKGQRPNQSIDLLQASFVQREDQKKTKNVDQDVQQGKYVDRNGKKGKAQKKQGQQYGVPQGKFENRNKKETNKNAASDFDQFLNEPSQEPANLDLKQREKALKKKSNENKSQQEIGQLATKQRNKNATTKIEKQKPQLIEDFIEGGQIIEHKKDKFRRGAKDKSKQQDNLEGVDYLDVQKKKISKEKKKDDGDDEVQEQEIRNKGKSKPKYLGDSGDNELGDEFQRKQKKQIDERKNRKGHLGVNEGEGEQYEDIRRKNKDNMFSPDKGAASLMMGSLEVGDFNDSDYESRPESKVQRPGSKGKGILGIDDSASVHESDDDSSSVRRQRVSAIQKLRKKQGNLDIGEKSDYSGDQSASSRPEKKEKRERKKRQKSGILEINKRDNGEQGVESIQLEKNK